MPVIETDNHTIYFPRIYADDPAHHESAYRESLRRATVTPRVIGYRKARGLLGRFARWLDKRNTAAFIVGLYFGLVLVLVWIAVMSG